MSVKNNHADMYAQLYLQQRKKAANCENLKFLHPVDTYVGNWRQEIMFAFFPLCR
jgi:hypothetical protein